MKRISIVGFVIVSMGVCLWQCSTQSEPGTSLKESLNINSVRLNKALEDIANSSGYRMLLADTEGSLKSMSSDSTVYLDSILLENISGIYEYERPDSIFYHRHRFFKLFQKTGESDYLIVKLPEEKLFHPGKLRYHFDQDTTGDNNFVITASAYHYYYAHGFIYDYGLDAGFDLDSIALGNLDIRSYRNSRSDYHFSSSYTFPDGYTINVDQTSGDTSTFSMALSEGSDILLQESVQKIKLEGQRQHEYRYTLIIGNVMIKRTSATDSMQVYLDGVLQPDARIEIIENDEESGDHMNSVRHNRDIQITFEDGTVTTVSELLGSSKEILGGLVDSIRDMSFAKRIVDYIAWNIYRGNMLE